MSKKLFLLPALLLLVSALFVTSCKKDCTVNQADYAGQYAVSEDCSQSMPAAYTIAIVRGAAETDLTITNVWGAFGGAVNATIDCETINIARQEPDGDGFFVVGSGFYEKSNGVTTITMSYTVTDETDPANIVTDDCTQTVYTKL